jgi:hypothetical protein
MDMAPGLIVHDLSKVIHAAQIPASYELRAFDRVVQLAFFQLTHLVLSVGASDGCAMHMAKNIMKRSPQIKHAMLLQV